MDKKKKRTYITFSKKQIVSIKPHHDSKVIDTKTNEVMQMYTIRLPSKHYRLTRFGKDSQDIDRDDRTATISLGAPYVFQNENNQDIFYSYPAPDREYTVNFKGHILGKDDNKKNIFDKPESIKITGEQLIAIFDEAKEISKKKNKELKKKSELDKNAKQKETKKAEKDEMVK